MSFNVTIAGTVFVFPDVEDVDWGQNVSDWALAVSTDLLQTTGGTFTLTADADFGASFGLKALFKSRSTPLATAGIVRLARVDEIHWRNEADGADVKLGVNSSNQLTFEGIPLGTTTSTVSDTSSINMTLSGVDISGVVEADGVVNAMINSAAAIALTKLAAVTASRALESNGSGFIAASAITAVELNRLSGVSSDIQTQLDTKFADTGIANRITVTNGFGDRVDLAALSGSKAMETTPVGLPGTSVTTAAELAFVSGATSNLQAQIDTGSFPAGLMAPCAGPSAPSGWLLADGTDISRTTFATLFALIGTTYGVGDGSTTFNIPDMRSRVPVGKNAAVSDFDALGKSGGEKEHTLTVAESAAHTHLSPTKFTITGSGSSGIPGLLNDPTFGDNFATDSSGGGGAHNNMPPFLIINWIIKT